MSQVAQESEEIVHKDVKCVNCGTVNDVEIRKKKPKIIIEEQQTNEIKQNDTKHEHTHEPKPDPHDELAQMLPKGVNYGKCANGNCGTKIKNAKGMTTKFKACPHCKANTVPKSNDYCPTCGKEPEEWDESDIELEKEDEDE